MPDEDLKTMVRELRARVATDLEAQHRRIDGIDGRLDGIAGRLGPG